MQSETALESLIFSNFCKLCDKISSCHDRKMKLKILKQYMDSLREKCPEADFYIILRFLLPYLERERGPYGVKEHNLAKIYIRILNLPEEGKDATMLMNFRNPGTANKTNDTTTDFAEVAYWILQNRCGDSENIKLGEINKYLDGIATHHAEHSPRAVDDILIEMLRKMSALEQKWLIRIILKNMHLGLGTKNILELYHPDSMELLDVSNNLCKVATLLKNPNVRLHEIDIAIFQPFKPMLSERCDISKINFTGEYIIDEKLDGERFQIHFHDGKFKYFSRNAFEYTQNFGENKDAGYYTSLLIPQINCGVRNFILDGEMMGWHTNRKCFVTKANNIDVKNARVGNVIQSCFCAFDVVYFNDSVLTNKPLIQRLEILNQIFEPLEGVISHTPRITVSKNEDILKALNNAIDNHLEGILLKDPKSLYKANSRNSGWFKIKPEYSEGALIELDLLILGGYFGTGRRKSIINQFLLGLAIPNSEGFPMQFSSVCRVGSGYTNLELGELLSKMNPFWQKLKPNKLPPNLLFTREKPDLWIEPSKSFILQVKASEVIKSDLYHFGYSLRFPRVEKVRYDKPWYDCLTVISFKEIVQTYSAKLTSGHIEYRKKRDVTGKLIQVNNTQKFSNISQVDNLFDNKRFCVLTGDKSITKDKVEICIVEHGGKIVNVPDMDTFCLIAGEINVRVKNVISSEKHIVAKYEWLNNCIVAGRLLNFEPDLVYCLPLRKKLALSKYFDETDDITAVTVRSMVENLPTLSEQVLPLETKRKIENALFNANCSPFSFFRGVHVYFYTNLGQNNESLAEIHQLLFKFYSGIIDDSITEFTNYIIPNEISADESTDFKQFMNEQCSSKNLLILNKLWIMDCCVQRNLINTNDYIIKL